MAIFRGCNLWWYVAAGAAFGRGKRGRRGVVQGGGERRYARARAAVLKDGVVRDLPLLLLLLLVEFVVAFFTSCNSQKCCCENVILQAGRQEYTPY